MAWKRKRSIEAENPMGREPGPKLREGEGGGGGGVSETKTTTTTSDCQSRRAVQCQRSASASGPKQKERAKKSVHRRCQRAPAISTPSESVVERRLPSFLFLGKFGLAKGPLPL
ncbi:hypothetical protein KC19_9G000700, partial [Ceratodon purpureus]